MRKLMIVTLAAFGFNSYADTGMHCSVEKEGFGIIGNTTGVTQEGMGFEFDGKFISLRFDSSGNIKKFSNTITAYIFKENEATPSSELEFKVQNLPATFNIELGIDMPKHVIIECR